MKRNFKNPELYKERIRTALIKRKNTGEKFGFQKGNKGYWTGKKRYYKNPNERRKRISDKMKGRNPYWINNTGINKGKNHYNWKGGITYNPYSIDWTETLRRSIRERDKYTCRICLEYAFIVHHIDEDKNNQNPLNLVTLCRRCHTKIHRKTIKL